MTGKNHHNSFLRRRQYSKVQFNAKKPEEPTTREKKVLPLLLEAREACARLGGVAQIDNRYSVIDTKYYNIRRKKDA